MLGAGGAGAAAVCRGVVCIALLSNECDDMACAGESFPGIRPAALWRAPIGRDGVYSVELC